MTASIFTAENTGGDIIIIHSGPGVDRDTFANETADTMRDMDGDNPDAQHLDLYEWTDEETFARWLQGAECVPFVGWPKMAEDHCYGRIEYCWPGQLTFLRPNEKPPKPSSAWMEENNPSPETDGYDPSDPKSDGYHDRMAEIYDLRPGK